MSAVSEVDICNLALDQIKGGTIVSLESPETNTEALCARWYHQTRREVLRKAPWNFAIKRIILARNSASPIFQYADAYDLPADHIRILTINEQDAVDVDYEIEDNQILLDNSGGPLYIRYIFDQQTVTKFDALFTRLFYLELAMKMAINISGKQTFKNGLAAEIALALTEASAIDGQERPPKRKEQSKLLRARRMGSFSNPTRYDM